MLVFFCICFLFLKLRKIFFNYTIGLIFYLFNHPSFQSYSPPSPLERACPESREKEDEANFSPNKKPHFVGGAYVIAN